ncbi:MAG: TonB-dependent receptor, partial [Pseudomonadota bacterium]
SPPPLGYSIRQQAGLGLLYADAAGWTASLVASYAGERYLNKRNSVRVGGYTTVDASVGTRLGKYRLQVNGYNLSDRRDAVAESDFHEAFTVSGTAGYYRLPARSVMLVLSREFP